MLKKSRASKYHQTQPQADDRGDRSSSTKLPQVDRLTVPRQQVVIQLR
ncbi:MAG: hypothetical protein EBE86_020715 [Hormoscilla sp. GUM202]|nr:hypothetical protein [Hormoscilla sp. GUM202]